MSLDGFLAGPGGATWWLAPRAEPHRRGAGPEDRQAARRRTGCSTGCSCSSRRRCPRRRPAARASRWHRRPTGAAGHHGRGRCDRPVAPCRALPPLLLVAGAALRPHLTGSGWVGTARSGRVRTAGCGSAAGAGDLLQRGRPTSLSVPEGRGVVRSGWCNRTPAAARPSLIRGVWNLAETDPSGTAGSELRAICCSDGVARGQPPPARRLGSVRTRGRGGPSPRTVRALRTRRARPRR